jgi:hypothetical protein
MTSPIAALKEAIRAQLQADAGVLALLREPKVYLDPPRNAAFPYAAFISAASRENGTGSDEGDATELGLAVFCRGNGSAEGLAVAEAVAGALAGMPAALGGHRLVNLIVLAVEPNPLKDGETWRVLMRLRAVTEVV